MFTTCYAVDRTIFISKVVNVVLGIGDVYIIHDYSSASIAIKALAVLFALKAPAAPAVFPVLV